MFCDWSEFRGEEESMTSDDMYSLEHWLREKALHDHNKACDTKLPEDMRDMFAAKVYAFAEVLSYIQSRKSNQRPHITEEFDGSR